MILFFHTCFYSLVTLTLEIFMHCSFGQMWVPIRIKCLEPHYLKRLKNREECPKIGNFSLLKPTRGSYLPLC